MTTRAVDGGAAVNAGPGLPITYGLANEPAAGARAQRTDGRALKTSEIIAVELVRDIVSRGLQVGDRLPDEAAMLTQYAVSRESLREALRILEVQGLITIRRGPGGGPQVAGVDPAYLARTSALYYHLSGATYDEVFETWLALEPAVAEKVALLPDRATVRKVLLPFAEHQSEQAQPPGSLAAPNGFHSSLAEMSGNRVLGLVLQSISHIVVDHVMLNLDPLQGGQVIENDHRAIAGAILSGRGPKARKLMARHITFIRGTYLDNWPERMTDLVEWR